MPPGQGSFWRPTRQRLGAGEVAKARLCLTPDTGQDVGVKCGAPAVPAWIPQAPPAHLGGLFPGTLGRLGWTLGTAPPRCAVLTASQPPAHGAERSSRSAREPRPASCLPPRPSCIRFPTAAASSQAALHKYSARSCQSPTSGRQSPTSGQQSPSLNTLHTLAFHHLPSLSSLALPPSPLQPC